MNIARTNNIKIPLGFRVVSLYIALAAVIMGSVHLKAIQTVVYQPVIRPQLAAAATQPIIQGKPERIIVARLGIDLPVIDGEYNKTNDSWTLTEDKAQFATMTTLPNDRSGNTFIYGHNTDPVFAPLANLQTGDEVQIITSNGRTFRYAYNGQQFVQPNNTDILKDNPPSPRLTLMTCEGILSQTRRIMYFDFRGVA